MVIRSRAVFDWDKALQLFQRGWKYRDIAAELGCSDRTLQRELKARGAQPSKRKYERTAGPLGPKLYRTWRHVVRRCERPSNRDYAQYGGRGIRFARSWRDFDAFYDWAVAAGYRDGLELDRTDRASNFTPGNCCWVTPGKRRVGRPGIPKRLVDAFGEKKSCAAWSRDKRCRVSKACLHERLAAGWPPEEALTAPPRARPSRIGTVVAKAAPRHRHRVNWRRALALYRKEGLSEDQIARRFGVTRAAVVRGLRLRGAPPRQRADGKEARERERLYHYWADLHRRCDDPRNGQFRFIGARGIRVARVWREFDPFLEWARSHGARPGLWLVRKDARKDWSPRNCEWVSPAVARRRERPHAMPPARRLVTAFGETKGISEWAKDSRCTVRDFTISRRLDKGWRPEDAIAGLPSKPGTTGRRLVTLRAFGEEKSKQEWLRDPRCSGVGHIALNLRLRQGWTTEDAIATPPWRSPKSKRQLA